MDKSLVSIFSSDYYLRATTGAIVFLGLTAYTLYHCLLGNLMYPAKAYAVTMILCAVDCLYYHLFSKSWKRVTITETEIIVDHVVFKKKLIVPFSDITSVTNYGSRGNNGLMGSAFGHDFVIETKNGQTLRLNEAWYENYKQLTMAIYLQRYGPGHGRERYLARH